MSRRREDNASQISGEGSVQGMCGGGGGGPGTDAHAGEGPLSEFVTFLGLGCRGEINLLCTYCY